ncbi:MAG: nitroreductase [Bacilli bacterium]|nr:nitroreductase [Bacilli bacterium]
MDPSIKVAMEIVKANETKRHCGSEYCLLLYSERKGNWLENVGYVGEQADLYMAAHELGALWYGLGSPKARTKDGLRYAIMIGFSKMRKEDFRKDMFASKRKRLEEIWVGPTYPFSNVVRFAPSACNTQNWRVRNFRGVLSVYRAKPTRLGIMPRTMATYFNRIDLGIFLRFLDVCLLHEGIRTERTLYPDDGGAERDVPVASYRVCDRSGFGSLS